MDDNMHSKLELEILKHTKPNIKKLDAGDITDAEHLFDPDYWAISTKSEHRVLGLHVSRLVRRGLLPLVSAGFDSSRHNLYRKI